MKAPTNQSTRPSSPPMAWGATNTGANMCARKWPWRICSP